VSLNVKTDTRIHIYRPHLSVAKQLITIREKGT